MACRSKRARYCTACTRPVGMLNHNACPNSSAAFTSDPKQAAQLSIRLPVPHRRGLRVQYFCSCGPVSDSKYGIENNKFTSQIPVCLRIWMKFVSKTCSSEVPPPIFLSAGTDRAPPSKFCAKVVTSKFLDPCDALPVPAVRVKNPKSAILFPKEPRRKQSRTQFPNRAKTRNSRGWSQ